ncbi:ATP-binding cassette domain-containing protein [Aurantimonas aggregata]|uniref:ATP-binding cassette domain-containing protein n=1 Tax=Aurantimonas aggregata TaxID=2047720 RepID=A0A6L9MK13_9HYPH|nr:ABC transporter ATP-binding protein [Aurantimonas aggregata]NDV88244.1 ATP-binding cassette domain-containing protein [Aurantimonas aggregata]
MSPADASAERHGAAVAIRGLTKTFKSTIALHPIELSIPKGEILVLLGPSGCGKTTLLRLIAGLEIPDGPDMVRFDDEDVSAVPIERRNVGLVFQSYALFPNMSVAENVGYGLKVRGMPGQARQAETLRLMQLVGIAELADRRISQISGGQRQRVALARALAIKPRILLLDEPLAALDAVLREYLRVEIGALLRRFGITAVYVTHDQAEAMAIGDRIAVMQAGRIAQIDTPQEIYRRPANAFVANFIGTMNRIEAPVANGVMTAGSGETRLSLALGGPDRAATVWFRPEAIRLSHGDGAISARVVATTFFGATQRLVAALDPGHRLQVDLPADRPFMPGERVAFDLDASDILEFPNQA